MKNFFCFILFNIILIIAINPVILKYKFKDNLQIGITTDTEQTNILNGSYISKGKSREITSLNVKNTDDRTAEIGLTSFLMQEISSANSKVFITKDKISSTFIKDITGHVKGFENKRGFINFLTFPETDLKPGDMWSMPAYLNIPLFKDQSFLIKIEMSVQYQFVQMKSEVGSDIAIITANAVIINNKQQKNFIVNGLLKFAGYSNFTVEYDVSKGMIKSINEIFDYYYILDDYSVIETAGRSVTFYNEMNTFTKKEVEEIKELVIADKDIEVKLKEDQSLSLNIINLKFKADSAELLEGELIRLDKIINVIKKYKDHNIIIVGHTADIGRQKAQYALSEDRAKVIYDYLIKVHNFDVKLMSYKGMGADEPAAENVTEAGRFKNRRVEIIILPEKL